VLVEEPVQVAGQVQHLGDGRFLYSGVSWATNAMPSSAAGDPAGRPPSTVTIPAVGSARPTARFSSVVLPAPFGPTSAVTCPGRAGLPSGPWYPAPCRPSAPCSG